MDRLRSSAGIHPTHRRTSVQPSTTVQRSTTSRPSIAAVPDVVSPTKVPNRVVLPTPLGPTTAEISPGRKSSDTCSSATMGSWMTDRTSIRMGGVSARRSSSRPGRTGSGPVDRVAALCTPSFDPARRRHAAASTADREGTLAPAGARHGATGRPVTQASVARRSRRPPGVAARVPGWDRPVVLPGRPSAVCMNA